jgi:hypothetical protein
VAIRGLTIRASTITRGRRRRVAGATTQRACSARNRPRGGIASVSVIETKLISPRTCEALAAEHAASAHHISSTPPDSAAPVLSDRRLTAVRRSSGVHAQSW